MTNPTGERGILKAVAFSATSDSRTRTLTSSGALPAPHTLLSDYAVLFKLGVSLMVIITAAAGFYLGSLRSGISPFQPQMWKALAGLAVVTCGSSALNQ